MTTIVTQPTTLDFLADDQNKGFKVRVNSDLMISIFDLAKGLTGQSQAAVRKTWSTLKKQHPRVVEKVLNSKFPHSRQKTWGCNVDTAIELVMIWPGKAASQFREQCARTIRRVMAGDETLVEEIRENAERTDDVTRLMQAETEREQNASGRQSTSGVIVRDEEWYDTREIQQKAAHHERVAAMKVRFPGAGPWQHIQWHKQISEAITGMTPQKFSQATGAPAKKRRDYYSSEMLHMTAVMDLRATKMFRSRERLPTWKLVQDEFKVLCEDTNGFSKKISIHGGELNHAPERPVLTYKKAMARNLILNK